jgi:hypothetical protein
MVGADTRERGNAPCSASGTNRPLSVEEIRRLHDGEQELLGATTHVHLLDTNSRRMYARRDIVVWKRYAYDGKLDQVSCERTATLR